MTPAQKLVADWAVETFGGRLPSPAPASLNALATQIDAFVAKALGGRRPARGDVVRCTAPDCDNLTRARGLCGRHDSERRREIAKNKARATISVLRGSPIETSAAEADEEVSGYRRLDCAAYNHCLGATIKLGWAGFSCVACSGPREVAS